MKNTDNNVPQPKMVNSPVYREEWERIFRPKKTCKKCKECSCLKTGEEWDKLLDSGILDPDGFDRANFQFSFYEEKISIEEFVNRHIHCTCQITPKYKKFLELYRQDPKYVICLECGLPRGWHEIDKMLYVVDGFVCKKCNYN